MLGAPTSALPQLRRLAEGIEWNRSNGGEGGQGE